MGHSARRCALPAAAASLLIIAGCGANGVRPDRDLARAEAAIEQAEQSGARQYSTAALNSAKEKLRRAHGAVEREEMVVAERLAEEAALDADLAAAEARSQKSQLAVKEVEDSIAALRQEIARNQRRGGDTE